MDVEVPVVALDELFDAFLTVQARITANLEAHAGSLGLNASQLLVIRDVMAHPGTSLKDTCQRCGLKKSAASRLIDALVERQMVIREECPTSRRAVSLRLGPALGEFCRTTTLTKALPGWTRVSSPSQYADLRTGLEAFLRLTEA